ncbi:MAG: MerR family transcriptional regulator [Bacteroidales bacterium]|nr:MerR family transcriptional regulator [Bacteroidales bacterium]
MANYSIKDLERLTGIKAHTIRIWEKRYGLIEPERTSTNIRAYCDAELKKLLNISILNKNGFKISKLAGLSSQEIAASINKLSDQPSDTESFIENLSIALIDIDEHKFEKILTRAIIQFGFEDTLVRIIMPFLVRIGVMWQTGAINPAQEHFVSHLIRQKIMVAIDSQITGESPSSKTFTLFLPEGELHELSLLFANYLLSKRGHQVIYLGQTVPISDLPEIERIKPSDYFLTSFVTSINSCEIIDYTKQLHALFPTKKIFIIGSQTQQITDSVPENVFPLNTPEDLIQTLNQLP